MIKRVRRNRDALHTTLSQQKHNLALPTNAEYEKLANLEKQLEPCRYITELLGGDKYVSCSVVLPALCHLQHVMKISDDDPAYIVRFKAAFTTDLNQRREKINLEWLKVETVKWAWPSGRNGFGFFVYLKMLLSLEGAAYNKVLLPLWLWPPHESQRLHSLCEHAIV
ncbi:unnamed protein product [Boreogadus saida]